MMPRLFLPYFVNLFFSLSVIIDEAPIKDLY